MLDLFDNQLFVILISVHFIAQMWTSVFLYRFANAQAASTGQLAILGLYIYAAYKFGWHALVIGLVLYIIYLLICNRVVTLVVNRIWPPKTF